MEDQGWAAPGCSGLRRAFPPGEGRAGRHTERREGRARVGSMETQPRMMNDECNATYETAAGSQAADVRRTAGAGAWQSGRCARPAAVLPLAAGQSVFAVWPQMTISHHWEHAAAAVYIAGVVALPE